MPPGLRRSEATLQTTFEVETPSEHESAVDARTAVRTASATARAPEKSAVDLPRSRYPSSSPVRSTRGTTSRTAAQTASEYCRYSECLGRTKVASGQRRCASAALMAEWMPNRRAA